MKSRFSWPGSTVFWHRARVLLPIGVLSACAVMTAAVMLLFYQQPAQQQLGAARASYEAARQMHQRLKTTRKTLEDLQVVWRMLPARPEFANLVFSLSERARQDHVTIPGMTYSFQKLESGLALRAAVTFRAAGAYEAIRRFIHRIETADSYLVVESLDANRSTRTNLVEFNVRVVTFLRPDPTATGAGP